MVQATDYLPSGARPVVTIEGAHMKALELLGRDGEGFYCTRAVLKGNLLEDASEERWELTFHSETGSRRDITIDMFGAAKFINPDINKPLSPRIGWRASRTNEIGESKPVGRVMPRPPRNKSPTPSPGNDEKVINSLRDAGVQEEAIKMYLKALHKREAILGEE